jgi:hypothetical protein
MRTIIPEIIILDRIYIVVPLQSDIAPVRLAPEAVTLFGLFEARAPFWLELFLDFG